MIVGQAVLLHEPLPLGVRQLGQCGLDGRDPIGYAHGHQIGLREVAIVVGLLLAANGDGDVAKLIEVSGLLQHLDVSALQVLLAGDLVGECLLHSFEAGDVLDLSPVTAAQRYVGIDSHGALQGAVEDIQVLQNALQLIQKGSSLLRGPKVGLGHYLQQGHAAAVVVHHGVLRLIDGSGVHQPSGVLLHVRPGYSDVPLDPVLALDEDVPLGGQRKVVLADLKAFWKIGIVVVLPVKERLLLDLAVQGQADFDAVLHGLAVEHGQGARQPQTDGTGIGVGLGAVILRGAAAK
ncbi:Uncharacterised protein [uncultured archaeon]|nr:Uncharacterised protein [uncultured archaeon]